MTIAYKVLGQSLPNANSWTTVYTVPAGNSAIISTIAICNTSNSTNSRYGISITKSGISAPTDRSSNTVLISDATIASNDTAFLTVGLTLGANDSLRANVTTGNANVSVMVFGSEVY